jgi:hypothetical protein
VVDVHLDVVAVDEDTDDVRLGKVVVRLAKLD